MLAAVPMPAVAFAGLLAGLLGEQPEGLSGVDQLPAVRRGMRTTPAAASIIDPSLKTELPSMLW